MINNVANILTSFRILGSILLLLFPVFSKAFYSIYLFCGFTDMIDGAIARKTESVSEFGSRFDTIADFVFMTVALIKIVPHLHIPLWMWIWIIIVALIKIFNIALVFIRKKKLISIHSVLNKTTGFTLFIMPLSLTFIKTTYSVVTVCVLATIAVMQEVYFIAKGQEAL